MTEDARVVLKCLDDSAASKRAGFISGVNKNLNAPRLGEVEVCASPLVLTGEKFGRRDRGARIISLI